MRILSGVLETGEEKQLIFAIVELRNHDGTADCATVLVKMKCILAAVRGFGSVYAGLSIKVGCVDEIVTNESEGVAMKSIGTGLGDNVDHTGSLRAAVLGKA